jgi:hypothetical protein
MLIVARTVGGMSWAGCLLRERMSLYDSTFSRTLWKLYGGAKGLVMWYYKVGGMSWAGCGPAGFAIMAQVRRPGRR